MPSRPATELPGPGFFSSGSSPGAFRAGRGQALPRVGARSRLTTRSSEQPGWRSGLFRVSRVLTSPVPVAELEFVRPCKCTLHLHISIWLCFGRQTSTVRRPFSADGPPVYPPLARFRPGALLLGGQRPCVRALSLTAKSAPTASTRIGFRVDSVDQIVPLLAQLGAQIVSQPSDSEWGRRAVVRDLDGHTVELLTPLA